MTLPELDCPDGQNYAAIALQVQETALQAEQRIYQVERDLRAAANRHTFVQTTTAARTGLTSGGVHDIAPGFVTTTVTFSNWPSFGITAIVPQVPGAGLYEVGVTLNAVASGAVTDNSHRTLRISQLRSNPNGSTVVEYAQTTVFEANVGGGMDMICSNVFDVRLGDFFLFEFGHGNTGSTMNISTGAIYWATYLGSTDTVEVF